MPHKCVSCGKMHASSSKMLNGCDCGSRVFFYIRGPGEPKPGDEADRVEHICAVEKGVYEVDLQSLFDSKSVVVKDHYGTYFVKLPSAGKK